MTKLILLLFSMTLFSCGQKGAGETAAPITEVKKASTTTAPSFNADSAYAYDSVTASRTRRPTRLVAIIWYPS